MMTHVTTFSSPRDSEDSSKVKISNGNAATFWPWYNSIKSYQDYVTLTPYLMLSFLESHTTGSPKHMVTAAREDTQGVVDNETVTWL